MTQNDVRAAMLIAIATMKEAAAKMLDQVAIMEANLPPEQTANAPEVSGDGDAVALVNTSAITAAVVAEAVANSDAVGDDGTDVKVETDTVVQGGQAVESLADLEKSGAVEGLVVEKVGGDAVEGDAVNEVKADPDLAVANGNSGDVAEAPAALENQAATVENQSEEAALETGGTKGSEPDAGAENTAAT